VTVVIRPVVPADLPALVAINDAAEPAVPVTPEADLRALVAHSSLALVADDGEPVGFLLALPPGRDYASENYRWFSARSESFLYVDRIVLAPRLRRQGVGARLYAEVFRAAAQAGAREVYCEVNVRPANPASLAFHARLGFAEVGRQETKGGAVEVALLAAAVPGAGAASLSP